MKITLQNENGTYSAEESGDTLTEVLELIERLVIAAGFSVEVGSLEIKEKN